MKPENIDVLIRLAFVEGRINTRGAYEVAARKRTGAVPASSASRIALLERLEGALSGTGAESEAPATVGVFLRSLRSSQSLQAEEILRRLGLSRNIYKMLEHDRISPLRVHPDVWKRFRQLFQLPVDALVGMIRRTHQLVFFRPAFRGTLARYDGRAKRSAKARALEQAATELYTRANLKLPPDEARKLAALLRAIRR